MTGGFTSLRGRLILLVLVAVLPALGLAMLSGLEQRRMARSAAESEATRVARIAGMDQSRVVQEARQVLIVLSRLPQVRNATADADCTALLRSLLPQNRSFANIGIADSQGAVLCSAVEMDEPITVADRPYFQRAMSSRDFAMGDYQVGRITHRPSVNLAYPLVAPGGQIQGVVFIAIDLAWLSDLAAHTRLPHSSVVMAIDRNGAVLARFPDRQEWMGRNIRQTALGRSIDAHRGGMVEATGLDGVPRLGAVMPLGMPGAKDDHPRALVYVGIPTAQVYGETVHQMTRNLICLGIVTLFALALAWLGGDAAILRPVRSLLAATQRMAAGDLSTRVGAKRGSRELVQLAAAFDEMAAQLQQDRAELQRLNAELAHRVEQRTLDLKRTQSALAQSQQDHQAAQLQLIEAQKMKLIGRLAAGVAHEVKNPLSIISMAVSILEARHIGSDPETASVLSDLSTAAYRADAMVRGLLDFSRPGKLHRVKTDLNAVIDQSLSFVKHELCLANVRVECELDEDLPPLLLDVGKIQQVFVNLFLNSIQAMDKGGTLTVRTRNGSAMVVAEVEDDGPGIAQEQLGRLFEAFESTKAPGQGTGLGLMVSRSIMEMHGAKIELGNRDGRGARATLSFVCGT